MSDCLFCKIINGEIPSKKLYEDEKILAFYDISPIAPVHFLVIPKQHIASVDAIDADNSAIVAYIFQKLESLPSWQGLKTGTVSSPTAVPMRVRRCSTCTSMCWAAKR